VPDGSTKTEAEQKLQSGYRTIGLDSGDIMPDWQIKE